MAARVGVEGPVAFRSHIVQPLHPQTIHRLPVPSLIRQLTSAINVRSTPVTIHPAHPIHIQNDEAHMPQPGPNSRHHEQAEPNDEQQDLSSGAQILRDIEDFANDDSTNTIPSTRLSPLSR